MPRNVYSLYTDYVLPGLRSLGVATLQDRTGGNTTGASWTALTIDAASYTRSDSATAWARVSSRSNLIVQTNSTVRRILWSSSSSGAATASGLAYLNAAGQEVQVQARRVVVAGGVQTPPILERSGVGDPAILQSLGIPTIINNPAVGRNLQDHPSFAASFAFNAGVSFTGAQYVQAFQDYAAPSRFLSAADRATAQAWFSATSAPTGVDATVWTTVRALWAADEPFIEYGWYGAFVGVYLLHPLSSGSVHAAGRDPRAGISLDPGYNRATVGSNATSIDLWLLSKGVQYYGATLPKTSAMSQIGARFSPDVAQGAGQLESVVAKGWGTGQHFTGGAALGSVVDEGLKLVGAANVWVGDLSVLPVVPGAHVLGMAYAVAETLATVLKGR